MDVEALKALIPLLNLLMVVTIAVGGWFMRQLVARFDRLEARLENHQRELDEKIDRTTRDLMEHKAQLPRIYVLRDDYIRTTTILERKLDALGVDIKAIIGKIGGGEL